jgi:hypothetical protein
MSEKTELIYISGPISGTNDFIERFKNTENYLIKKYNIQCLNPVRVCARHYAYPDREKWETLILLLLDYMSRNCTHIYMMPGWENSYGARIEKLWAEKLNLIFLEGENHG